MARSLVIILLILVSSCRAEGGNEPLTHLHSFSLGNSLVHVREFIGESHADLVFIQLHHDEQTAVNSALEKVRQSGGKFISVENDFKRIISFDHEGKVYQFDPNRIFSKKGREASLKVFGKHTEAAEKEVEKFAAFLLSLLPPESVVIAVHNNTNQKFSISDYRNGRSGDAQKVYINENLDADDFILTTDPAVYRQMEEEKLNVVLQDNEQAADDGSLSILMGRQGRNYINIEAEHGHTREQERMLAAVTKALKN